MIRKTHKRHAGTGRTRAETDRADIIEVHSDEGESVMAVICLLVVYRGGWDRWQVCGTAHI